MSDAAPQNKDGKTPLSASSTDEHSLEELRGLLLGPFRLQLKKLQERLDNPLHADDVSRVLPEAIALRAARDKKIALALEPITENAIKASIKRDRKILVDALFPVMGPAIRKAIAAALQGMIQSFNQILEHSLSLKGLKWRFEALRTGKPFAEVVLLHTLLYHVEQVFLIHKDTGLVLQHVVAKSIVSPDPDLVSGMLTAIKDFVQESFGVPKEDALETLRIGERSIWIEQGDQAFLAAVVRGNPPMDFQLLLREAIEEIHFKQSEVLTSFDGDTTAIEQSGYILENCLQARLKEEKRKKSYITWFLLGVIFFLIGIWLFQIYTGHRRWLNFMVSLHNEPGIVVTADEKKSGKHLIFGLRDPLAPDPQNMLQKAGIASEKVSFHWEPYHSAFPAYANQRIQNILKPPDTIKLELKDGTLSALGCARHEWLLDTRKWVKLLPWIQELRDDDVIDIDLTIDPPETVSIEVKGRTLFAYGAAPHHWLVQTRQLAKSLPGIIHFEEENLIDTDLMALENVKKKIESQVIFFKPGGNELAPDQNATVNDLVEDLKQLFSLAKIFDRRPQLEIIGHSDNRGNEELNIQIRRERARAFRLLLVSKGIAADNIIAKGAETKKPLREENSEQDRAYNRSLTFKVHDKGHSS